ERRKQAAGTLSGGEQQMLAMGRALMSQPKLLMLDEPSMGLSPIMMQKIMATIAELKAQGTTILLVEQNAQAALSLADQGHVMETGNRVRSGTGRDLLHDEPARTAYLGEDWRRRAGSGARPAPPPGGAGLAPFCAGPEHPSPWTPSSPRRRR